MQIIMRVVNFRAQLKFPAPVVVSGETDALREDDNFVVGEFFNELAAKLFLIDPQVTEIAAADQKDNVVLSK